MQTRTEGIVLKSMAYGEADVIVTYLTADLGIRKGFAKSARKIKSRFGGSLEPFTHSRITLLGKEDASLPRLTQSDITGQHHESLTGGDTVDDIGDDLVDVPRDKEIHAVGSDRKRISI